MPGNTLTLPRISVEVYRYKEVTVHTLSHYPEQRRGIKLYSAEEPNLSWFIDIKDFPASKKVLFLGICITCNMDPEEFILKQHILRVTLFSSETTNSSTPTCWLYYEFCCSSLLRLTQLLTRLQESAYYCCYIFCTSPKTSPVHVCVCKA